MPKLKNPLSYKEADDKCFELSRAHGMISSCRDHVRAAGANKAADYISRALKSLDGSIRHAQRMRFEAARREGKLNQV